MNTDLREQIIIVIGAFMIVLTIVLVNANAYQRGVRDTLWAECVLHGGTPVADRCVNAQAIIPLRPE
jgi:hypothetical protein